MSNLRERLAKRRAELSEEYGADNTDTAMYWVDKGRRAKAHLAGSAALEGIVLELAEALEKISNADEWETIGGLGIRKFSRQDCIAFAKQALARLSEFLGER